jgi:hypothetical protein
VRILQTFSTLSGEDTADILNIIRGGYCRHSQYYQVRILQTFSTLSGEDTADMLNIIR